jgi:uncharacterized protein DUF4145
MPMRWDRAVQTPSGRTFGVFVGTCPHCNRESTFQQLETHLHMKEGDEFGPLPHATIFAACLGCTRCLLIGTDVDDQSPLTVIPSAQRRFPDPDYARDVPPSIRRILDETYAAESRQAWTLVGLGCRVAIERMAALHGITNGMLGKKLDAMRDKFPGLAGPLENAEVVKLVGNAAAHDTAYDLGEAEASAALEFVEEVLRDVYILPARRKRVVDALPKKGTK